VKYLILGLSLAVLLAGCVQQDTGGQTQLPNPASVNCVDKGYQLEMRSGAAGEYGVCKYAGSECEEWALYRHECCFQAGDCACSEGTAKCENQQCRCDTGEEQPPAGVPNPAAVNCENKGYTYEIRSGTAGEYGVCKHSGKECEEWALYRQECCLQAGDCSCTAGTAKCENQKCGCATEPAETLPPASSKTTEQFLDEGIENLRYAFFGTHDGSFTVKTVKWTMAGGDMPPDVLPLGVAGMENTVKFDGKSTKDIRGLGFILFYPTSGGLADASGIVVLNARTTILDTYYENAGESFDIDYDYGTKSYALYDCVISERQQYLAGDGSWITNYLFSCYYGEDLSG